jgi:urease accessory protein
MNPDLLLLADGRFPAGGHSWSAGVEAAVGVGDVVDPATLGRYLAGRLATSGTVDAAFAAAACAAALDVDRDIVDLFDTLDREYDARVPSGHLRTTGRRLGRHFLRAARPIWPGPALDAMAAPPEGFHQPIVLGAVVATAGGLPGDAATIALHHTATAVTTAAVRLLGLDPMELAATASRALRDAAPSAATVTVWAQAAAADLPSMGGSLTEILGEHHGHLDARLFVA